MTRLRKQAAEHNWFGVAVDLVILVLGVFLGMQVNDWNQNRLDQARGAEYRQRLIGDLDANLTDLADRKTYYAQVKHHAEAMLAAMDGAPPEPARFLVDAYQASQITPRSVRHFTYDEIVSTGNAINLGPPALREQVANYYVGVTTTSRTFDFVSPYREHLRAVMPNDAQQAVRTQCGEVIVLGSDGVSMARLPSFGCTVKMDPVAGARAVAILREEPGLRTELARLIADSDVKIMLTESLAGHARQLRGQLVAAH